MQTQNPITPQIEQAINYYTNRLSRSFRLQLADKDDIRQELTLKALEAIQCYSSDMSANIETYTKQALRRKAVDLARQIMALPMLNSIDAENDLSATEKTSDLVMDVQTLIKTLTARQQAICAMLMSGHTQEEIGKKLHVTKQRISQIIDQIRRYLKTTQIAPCQNSLFSV